MLLSSASIVCYRSKDNLGQNKKRFWSTKSLFIFGFIEAQT